MVKKHLLNPIFATIVVLAAVFWWGGMTALILTAVLAILEVSLSFDNAIVNAKVLERMTPQWQKRFLTWGILLAVVGVRFILPIVIVSITTLTSPLAIANLAFSQPALYAGMVAHVRPAIEAFGGMFLLMVALRFFFDETKHIHWIYTLERRLCRLGRIEAIEAAVALIILLVMTGFPHTDRLVELLSGMIGIIVFILIDGFTVLLDTITGVLPQGSEEGTERLSTASAASPMALFAYLEMIDVAFSLDGVVSAFAITISVPIMVAGLGIGAYFVRSLTVAFAEGGVIKTLRYLEHGAHYAIGALALSMLVSLSTEVPQWLTASIGLIFVSLAFFSSRRAME